jgi:hypothetical protein
LMWISCQNHMATTKFNILMVTWKLKINIMQVVQIHKGMFWLKEFQITRYLVEIIFTCMHKLVKFWDYCEENKEFKTSNWF